jgi:hypothetical protein
MSQQILVHTAQRTHRILKDVGEYDINRKINGILGKTSQFLTWIQNRLRPECTLEIRKINYYDLLGYID